MKLLKTISLLTIVFFFSCQNSSTKKEKTNTISKTNQIEVIDFYGTHRCITCKAIEASAKHTIDTYFTEEVKKGTVSFKTVNVDDDANYNIAKKFEATGTALFLNVIVNGKETKIDLTDFGFEYGRNQEKFSSELKIKIENELKRL